jgi:hypothetical protein
VKTIFLLAFIPLCMLSYVSAQTTPKTDPVIEGGKIIVELFKALGNKKEQGKDPGCKGVHADICVENGSSQSMTLYLEHRATAEKREVVVMPGGKEFCLQARVGVWTYDLKASGTLPSIRKGDILIEGCNNMVMQIK